SRKPSGRSSDGARVEVIVHGCRRFDERTWGAVGRDGFDVTDEAIAASGQRFNEARPRRVVADGAAQALHRGIQAVLEVDERARRPEMPLEAFAVHHLTRMFEQDGEQGEALIRQQRPPAVATELSRLRIEDPGAEPVSVRETMHAS